VSQTGRPGNDLTRRFPRIVEGVARLKARTCIIDGEAVACGPDGIALFRSPHWMKIKNPGCAAVKREA
jgi:ATP-dependent DNA ligase